MTLSSQAAAIESENESLKAENRALHEAKILSDFEVAQYKAKCAKAEAERDSALKLATDLRSILDHAASGIVSGLNRISTRHQDKRPDNIVDAEFNEAPPLFLQKGNGRDHSETFQ